MSLGKSFSCGDSFGPFFVVASDPALLKVAEQIVHHADVTAFGKVLIVSELTGILKFISP